MSKFNISNLLENQAAGSTENLADWVTSITTYTTNADATAAGKPADFSVTSATKLVTDVDGAGAGTATQTIWLRNFTAAETTALDAQTKGWLVV